MRSTLVLMLLLLGCDGQNDLLGSTDVRIDGAPAGDGDPESEDPRMCVTEDGEIHVVWVDDRDGTPAVWFNTSTNGGDSWLRPPIRVNRGGGAAFAPDLSCSNAVVHVVWEDDRDGELENHNIFYNRSGDGGMTWNEVDRRLTEDVDGESMSLGPDLVAMGDDVYVAWFDSMNGAYDIYFTASHDRGQTWSAPLRLDSDDPGEAYSAWPRIAVDSAQHVYVAWEDSRSGMSDIYAAASSTGGASFWPEVRIDGGDALGEHDSFSPRLSADENGSVYVVWHDTRNGAERDIYLNWSINHGQNWATDAVRVDSDAAGFFDSLNPDVLVVDGTTYVAWQDGRSGGYDTFVRQAESGVFYEAEQRVDTDSAGRGNSLHPQVVRNGDTVVVIWEDRRDDDGAEGYNDVYYNYSLDAGTTWSSRDLRVDSIAAGTSYAVDIQPALYRDPETDEVALYAVWTDGRRGTADIFFQSLPVGEEAGFVVEEERR
jgi:hypothetical protein